MTTHQTRNEINQNRRIIAWATRNINDRCEDIARNARTILEVAKRDGWKTN